MMKRLLLLILATVSLNAAANDGGFATAKEFGSPKLELTAPEPMLPTPLRQWNVAGERPFLAQLTGISGKWGKNATISLRTPTGRVLRIPAQHLSDKDLQTIRDYMQAEHFVQLHTYRYGTLDVKLLSVRRLSKEELLLEVLALDGTRHFMRANAEPWQEEYARKVQYNETIVMQEETRNMLLQQLNLHAKPQTKHTPLPVAENAMEALTYAALRELSVVVITMGPRGCKADVHFRRYLNEHPEAAGIWAQQYVFLIAYTDSTGTLPPTCCRELAQLNCHHDNKASALTPIPAGQAQLRQCSESLCGTKYTLLRSSLTETRRAAAPAYNTFSYKIDELQKSMPQHINFTR